MQEYFFILGNLYFLKETATKLENQYVPNGSDFSKNHVSKNRAFDFLKWSLKSRLEIHKSTNWILMENQGCFSKGPWMKLWKIWRQRMISLLERHWLDPSISFLSKKEYSIKDKWRKQLIYKQNWHIPPFPPLWAFL